MTEQSELFDLAPAPPRRPTEPIVRAALVEDGCRYWLKRAWGPGPLICWVMCNPSEASGTRDDPTMWRVMEFSMRWGYGSCVVINPIPLISSTPAAALAWARKVEAMDHSYEDPTWCQWNANIGHCNKAIDEAAAHVVAWGNNIPEKFAADWLQCLAEAADAGKGGGMDEGDPPPVQWICLGTNSNGSPRHPLSRGKNRVPADFKPVPWKAV